MPGFQEAGTDGFGVDIRVSKVGGKKYRRLAVQPLRQIMLGCSGEKQELFTVCSRSSWIYQI